MKTRQRWLRTRQAVSMKGNLNTYSDFEFIVPRAMEAANKSKKGYAYIFYSLQGRSNSI